MTVFFVILFGFICVVIAILLILLAYEQRREIKEMQRAQMAEAQLKAKAHKAAEEYLHEAEKMETGSATDDFNATLDVLHQHSKTHN